MTECRALAHSSVCSARIAPTKRMTPSRVVVQELLLEADAVTITSGAWWLRSEGRTPLNGAQRCERRCFTVARALACGTSCERNVGPRVRGMSLGRSVHHRRSSTKTPQIRAVSAIPRPLTTREHVLIGLCTEAHRVLPYGGKEMLEVLSTNRA